MEPDATLGLLGVVILEIEAEGFVVSAGSAHDEGALGYCQHESAAGEGGNVLKRTLRLIRRCCCGRKRCTHDGRDEDIAEGAKIL